MNDDRSSPGTSVRRIIVAAAIGLLSACGDTDTSTEPPSEQSEPTSVVGGALSEAEAAEAALPPVPDSSARLSLANGDVLRFSITCVLRPQIVESFEIQYSATSSETPAISIRQDGETGRSSGAASIRVEDADSKALWEAGTVYVNSGGTAALSLDGTTITGVGGFFQSGDFGAAPINGTLTARC